MFCYKLIKVSVAIRCFISRETWLFSLPCLVVSNTFSRKGKDQGFCLLRSYIFGILVPFTGLSVKKVSFLFHFLGCGPRLFHRPNIIGEGFLLKKRRNPICIKVHPPPGGGCCPKQGWCFRAFCPKKFRCFRQSAVPLPGQLTITGERLKQKNWPATVTRLLGNCQILSTGYTQWERKKTSDKLNLLFTVLIPTCVKEKKFPSERFLGKTPIIGIRNMGGFSHTIYIVLVVCKKINIYRERFQMIPEMKGGLFHSPLPNFPPASRPLSFYPTPYLSTSSPPHYPSMLSPPPPFFQVILSSFSKAYWEILLSELHFSAFRNILLLQRRKITFVTKSEDEVLNLDPQTWRIVNMVMIQNIVTRAITHSVFEQQNYRWNSTAAAAE